MGSDFYSSLIYITAAPQAITKRYKYVVHNETAELLSLINAIWMPRSSCECCHNLDYGDYTIFYFLAVQLRQIVHVTLFQNYQNMWIYYVMYQPNGGGGGGREEIKP